MRRRIWSALAVVLLLVVAGALVRSGGRPVALTPVARSEGDSGDAPATTTYDDAMVRKRAAIAIHPVPGADRAHIRRELTGLAAAQHVGPLAEATFAVFSEEMLNYLVPEMTFVLPENVDVDHAEAFMRDQQPADVAFYLVEPVLVHDLTFAVIPDDGVTPAAARAWQDREGILADTLNHYVTTVQPAGLTVRYFGALLSDESVGTVRAAMGRAAHVPADRVQVEATLPGPGVDLSQGLPDLSSGSHHHH
jgi:hypothetical protein